MLRSWSLLAAAAALAPSISAAVDFNRQIRPILSDNCFACHGPDEKTRMAGLRLDDKESALRVITPGNRKTSKLYQRIGNPDAKLRMPPQGSQRALTKEQIELIGAWIDEGAPWRTHWAYAPPQRPDLPSVKLRQWARNPIDYFVLARLEKEGLRPSPEADKPTLIRRLSFDLTGLPPEPEQVKAFLEDRSPNAYEKLVDTLLASPHYGERMAMMWLDLARYADTHGYHIDSHRDMWPWRDWVIRAFNANMPFDRFTIEQLAGDLLPGATREQLIATGFNRNHMINYEGGAIAEEYLVEYVADRVETTATTWMGMTMGCARCHDHKYDPISQRDYYRFFAFFHQVDEKGLDGREGNAQPVLALPTTEQHARSAELEQAIAARKAELPEAEIAAAIERWARKAEVSYGPSSAVAHFELDGGFGDISGRYHQARLVRGNPTFAAGVAGQSVVLDGETQIDWARAEGQAFTAAFWLRPNNKLEMGLLHRWDPKAGRGVWIRLEEATPIGDLKRGAKLRVRLAHRWPDDAIEVRTRRPVVQNEFTHIAISYDGSARASNLRIYLNGEPAAVETLKDELRGDADAAAPWSSTAEEIDKPARAQFDDLRIYNRALDADQIRQLYVEAPVRAILQTPAAKWSKDQKERVRDYYLLYAGAPAQRAAYKELKRLEAEKKKLDKQILTTMVMRELESPRDTYVLARGDYRNRGEKVAPAVPASLPPLPPHVPANRLGLAKWLVDPSHPLTARVAVNRFWQMYFGSGLVETSEDFGSQGSPPTHPELLDWLATEFIRTGWDVKGLQRLIVTSTTYRQSSKASPELIERDPQNRLLGRMARFRLPAEMVRDNALAVSGLLQRAIGGPSVFPYQPAGLWEEVAYGDVFSAQTYTPSHGKDLYRRSLYTFWKRTSPPPALATFDAPDREKCVARRPRTNTPLQALVLMNDPTYVEAGRALAQRAIQAGGKTAAGRVRAAFLTVLAREPQSEELRLLVRLAEQQRRVYKRNPEAAVKLLAVGESKPEPGIEPAELAAWTIVCTSILNLDETITKE